MLQKMMTGMKKNEGFIAIETILVGAVIIALAGYIAIQALGSGHDTAETVVNVVSHDSSFINESTKNQIIQ